MDLDVGGGVTMKLVLIPAGTFIMGSPDNEKDRDADEGPQHEVTISRPFYMGVCEVTQAQYEQITGRNPSRFKGAGRAVEQADWNDAVDFCSEVSQKTGKRVRLPTEAEWEYACRAGTTTPFNTGETISTDQANFNGEETYSGGLKGQYRRETISAGSFKPNAFGLHDMHGGVWEWCSDWYSDSYADAEKTDPQGPTSGVVRVLRGGSWRSVPRLCRSGVREWGAPWRTSSYDGFRVVVESE